MCFFGGGDGPDYFDMSTRTARKEHGCDGCRRVIKRGEKYHLIKTVSDGTWDVEKACAECDAAIEQFGAAHDGWPFPSYFREALVDCISDGDEESDKKWRPMLEAMDARKEAAAHA